MLLQSNKEPKTKTNLHAKYVIVNAEAWFPPMRLTYSEVYSYKNKHNPIGGNASNDLKKKKINLTTLREIIRLFS